MRSFFLTSLAVAGLAASAAAHTSARKSLGFGPVHPSAGLRTVAPVTSFAAVRALDEHADPLLVAREFMKGMVPSGGYVIRDDSYTDKATGVTHVYVRQLVDGVEVADGDMNLNIKDGVVMSYGDSVRPPLFSACSGRPLIAALYSSTAVRSQSSRMLVLIRMPSTARACARTTSASSRSSPTARKRP